MMKTSFTQYLRKKWIHYIPILFLSFSINIASYAACDVSWSDVTMTINCEGDFDFTIDNKDFKSVLFAGYVDGEFTSYWPVPAIHAASTYDSESAFRLEVECTDGSKDILTGTLPEFSVDYGVGGGTYTFTGDDDTGVVDEIDELEMNFGLEVQLVEKSNPTCGLAPNDMDGFISVKVVGSNLGKCEDTYFAIYYDNGVSSAKNSGIITKVDSVITIPNLGAGTYNIHAYVDAPSCPCDLGEVASLGPVVLVAPTSGTTSLACNSQVNVSVSQGCVATIQAMDMLRGVIDPCNPMLAMIDSMAVLAGGTFLGGSGSANFGITIPDVTDAGPEGVNILGQPLTVEVYSIDGNYCWGTITLEDKSAPIVTCNDPGLMEISCLEFDGTVMNTIDGLVEDCSPFTTTILAQSEINNCDILDDGIMRRVAVTYFATDIFGNRSRPNCVDTIDVLRFDTIPGNGRLDVPGCVLMPPAFTLEPKMQADTTYAYTMPNASPIKWPVDSLPLTCTGDYARLDPNDPDNPAPAPISIEEGGSGFPRLLFTNSNSEPDTSFLFPLNYKYASDFYKRIIDDNLANCNIGVDFDDLIFDFGCKIKIQRQWFLREWSCDGELNIPLGVQEIIVTDFVAPFFVETVPDLNDTVDPFQCSKFWNIPKPVVDDNCDADEIDIELAIYDADEDGNWNLIGPTIGPNGQQMMTFDFPAGVSYVVYTAFDDCGNSASDTTMVTIDDVTRPTAICKEFLVIGISGDGNVVLPASSIDNGSSDQCELERICVTRMDDIELFNSIDTDNNGEVLFGLFDDACRTRAENGDGCYRDFSTSSYERDGNFYIDRHSLCTPYAEFCCADAVNQGPDGIMVEMRVYDVAGNFSPCMTFVELQDKNLAVTTCVPDITIDCNFTLPEFGAAYNTVAADPLSNYFGSIVTQGNQNAFGIPDEFILSSDTIQYVDGTIFDNCNIPRISVEIDSDIDNCGFGYIKRRFYSHEDSRNRRLICTQLINIDGNAKEEVGDLFANIRDTTLVGCMTPEQIINESFGTPNVNEFDVACSLLGVSTENQLFLFNTQDQESDACFKIVRTFTIIDWCKSTTGNPFAVDTFRQIIKVNDPEGPVITCSDDLTGDNVVTTVNCDEQEVMLMATATDQCTEGRDHSWSALVELDEDGDGIYERFISDPIIVSNETSTRGSKATHTYPYPLGTHRITWTVSDRCGNISQCVQNFTIINTKKPTPFAIDISTVLMNTNGMVEVWAADLENKANEGPCGETLLSSIVRTSDVGNRTDGGFGLSQSALTFTCADVGEEGIDVNYFVYFVADQDSIFDYTTVNIRIQDNNDVCDNTTTSFITGNISDENKNSLPNVSVALVSAGNVGASALESAMTNERGNYAFPAMPIGGAYKIDPSNEDDYLNGVSTLDIVIIQRYILGLIELDSPYKIIAADVNNDQGVTALDLVELRSVILGYKDEFRNNESWRFIDENFVFVDPSFPFEDNFNEIYDIHNLSSNMAIDFVGLKVGDVNGSVKASSLLADTRSKYNLSVEEQVFEKGEDVSITLSASQAINTLGLQLSLAFDSDILSFVGLDAENINISSEHIGIQNVKNGTLKISWSDFASQKLASGMDLFTLQFVAKKDGRLSQILSLEKTITKAEIYNEQLETSNLDLVFNEALLGQGFSLNQNIPNPFAENTQISFYLPVSSDATLTISDVTGRVIKNYTGSFDKGNNFISISKSDLSVTGVLYYTLETDQFTDTKRMVVLK